jgi:hypothetical protein
MVDVRQKAREFLDQLPPNVNVTSNGSTAALFTKLTGSSHEWLQARWAIEDEAKALRRAEGKSTKGLPTTTTCNGLVGQLGIAIGSPIALGQFDIEQKLKAAGMGEAWIPAASGKKPGYGDVFRPVSFHMGVSLDFVGNDTWNTAEAGQGGPGDHYATAFDIVKRKQQPWNPANLQGWVDIEILLKVGQKAPKWMIGWWRFEVGATKEFVWLPERGSVRAFTMAPASAKQAPPAAGGKTGEKSHEGDGLSVAIAWPDNVTDTLRRLPNVDYMLGDRGGQQLQAFKMK